MTIIDVIRGDITKVRADVVVNAANSTLLGGGGVDGAIHRVGGPDILRECKLLRATTLPDGLAVGAVVATGAGDLPARWVIHAVGPRYSRHEDRSGQLRSCYRRSLLLADALGASSTAFPLISAGVYGWPVDDAVAQQVAAITSADVHLDIVTLVAFSREVEQVTARCVG